MTLVKVLSVSNIFNLGKLSYLFLRKDEYAGYEDDSLSDLVASLSKFTFNLTHFKIISSLGSISMILFFFALLKMPKLTLEKGHFWIVFGGFALSVLLVLTSVPVFLQFNHEAIVEMIHVFLHSTKPENSDFSPDEAVAFFEMIFKSFTVGLYVPCFVFAGISGLINAAIFTMDEDYDGCCSCLKCFKPYKPKQVLPSFSDPKGQPMMYQQWSAYTQPTSVAQKA